MASGWDRREFLAGAGRAIAAATIGVGCGRERGDPSGAAPAGAVGNRDDAGAGPVRWEWVRAQFELSPEPVHLSALLLSSHPAAVREAIERHRRALDRDPALYLIENNARLRERTLEAAAAYLGGSADDVALTDSTTMGLGLVYNGVRLRPGQEILATEDDYYVTHESIRLASERSGAPTRRLALPDPRTATSAELVARIAGAVGPRTRVLALTWVHSGTGLKLPLAQLAAAVRAAERRLGLDEPVLICVDAVHGFGVEDAAAATLGVDFFVAGCHKWLFGPRGTGLVWGTARAWAATLPVIPSFIEADLRQAWRAERDPTGPVTAATMTPGGFKAFEHRWALAEAFALHERIGRGRVASRTHALARQCKEGLAGMAGVTLRTPLSEELSSGIVCFDVDGADPWSAVARLRRRGIVATVTPYATRHVRVAPCIYNTPEDVEALLRAIRDL
jgi:isopenicillin-N epimerase